ncbi:MAG: hypothetical protein DYG88_16715 [Chloroflexi bacterium CFX4]|nr:hypothetical protein [Chloroflexi bacterium CFX4]MDL1921807.1 hypothetical protein [Chloroflexi bacterium CFX3]
MRALLLGIALSIGLIAAGGMFWANLPNNNLFSILNWEAVRLALENGQANLWWLGISGVVIAGIISAITVLIAADSPKARAKPPAGTPPKPAPTTSGDTYRDNFIKLFGEHFSKPAAPPPAAPPPASQSTPDAETNTGIQIGFITVLAFTAVIAFMVGFGGIAGGAVGGVLFGVLGGALNPKNRPAGVVIGVCVGVGVGVGLSMNGVIGALLGGLVGFSSLLSIGIGASIYAQRKRHPNLRGSGWITAIGTVLLLIPLFTSRAPSTNPLELTVQALERAITAQVRDLTATAEQGSPFSAAAAATATSDALLNMQQSLQQTQTALSALVLGATLPATHTPAPASPTPDLALTQTAQVRDLATAIAQATRAAQSIESAAPPQEASFLAGFAEFLRDPIFQGIGAILALFGLFATYWQGRTQSRR